MARQKVPGTNINKPIKAETNVKFKGNPDQKAEQQNLLAKLKKPSAKMAKKATEQKKAKVNNPNRKPKNG